MPGIETEEQLSAHTSYPFEQQALDGLATKLVESDVVISTFPKCGTTWSAQICHGLRSKGDMSFGILGEVFPWFEMGYRFGHDLSTPQAFSPNLFKSHMQLSELPPGGKIINIVRNPGDTLLSYYNFWSDVLFDTDKINHQMMANQFFINDRSGGPRSMFRLNYFQHLIDFHTTEYDGKVLYIAYEDMKTNLPAAVRRIARFMDIDLSKTLERKVVEQASFVFMSQHKEKFTEQVPGGVMEMVVSGQVGEAKKQIDPKVLESLDQAWSDYVTPVLGYQSYDQLRDAISLSK